MARLLLVDDDQSLCAALARGLERRGYDVGVAHDSRTALNLATKDRTEFAVVDLRLPDGSGLGLLERLLKLDKGMRVVVLTGYGSIATAVEAIRLGALHYLVKPVTVESLEAALHRGGGSQPPLREELQVREEPLSVNRMEWEHIQRVLTENHGNVSATARHLGMHRRTLQRKLRKYPARD